MNFFAGTRNQSVHKAMILQNYLLLAIAALLITWLEGGFPPSAYVLLMQTALHMSTLVAQHGQVAFWILALFIGQCVLLTAVWSLLICLAIREYRFFAHNRSGSFKASDPATPSSHSFASMTNSIVARTHLLPKDILSLLTQTSQSGSRRNRALRTQDQWKRASAKGKNETPYHNPYAEEVLKNPFENAAHTGDGGRRRSTVHLNALPQEPMEQQQEEILDSNHYKYGNPFEGLLPEVFEYDTDLKDSLIELEREREAASHEGQSKTGSNKNAFLPQVSTKHAVVGSTVEKDI
jgi:hypothetical protein